MTDRLQECGYIYYRGCTQTRQSHDGNAARGSGAVSPEGPGNNSRGRNESARLSIPGLSEIGRAHV